MSRKLAFLPFLRFRSILGSNWKRELRAKNHAHTHAQACTLTLYCSWKREGKLLKIPRVHAPPSH